MEQTGFWVRMGQWFKSISGAAQEGEAESAAGASNGHRAATKPNGTGSEASTGLLSRVRGQHGANLERLEREYARVVNLIESVHHHLEEHGARSERIVTSLDRLAENLSHMPDSARSQLDLLTKIGERVAADAASARSLEQSLSQLPRLADAQRETMVVISRQLDASRESSERVASMLDGFHKGLAQVAEATGATGRALEKSRSESVAREDRLAAILQYQTKRLTIFAVAAISLASVAALASVIAMFF